MTGPDEGEKGYERKAGDMKETVTKEASPIAYHSIVAKLLARSCRWCSTVKRPRGDPNPMFRINLNTQLPTATVTTFFRVESDVGHTRVWDE